MPTIRGFVERLEIGRAGLVTVTLSLDDGTHADYTIHDLDADPERFNERLSKLGILRDAMTRAEPVEVEYDEGEGGAEIQRVVRITRDMLAANAETQRVAVFIVGVSVLVDNRTGMRSEAGDRASVATMTAAGALATYVLELQVPERVVAGAQLDMIRAAQASGTPLTLTLEAKAQRIVGVEAGDTSAVLTPGDGETVDGFVESVAVAPGLSGGGNYAVVQLTTAPPFAGAGNVVELAPFAPALRKFLVVQGSLEYELFVDGLRDKLRMRVMGGPAFGRKTEPPPPPPPSDNRVDLASGPAGIASSSGNTLGTVGPAGDAGGNTAPILLVRGAMLLAPLASASRPVWIQITRQSLDVGPEPGCTEGLPSSDLAPQGLRDLQIPYTAEWTGCGCFNHGVYRLQFELAVEFEAYVDDEPLCVHASADGKTRFAHACLDGEHCVRIVLHGWTCKAVFRMDVYRIR